MVTAADKGVSAFNRSYGFCALHQKNMACPYKDCVHKLVTDELQTEADHEPPNEKMETRPPRGVTGTRMFRVQSL